MFEYKDYLIEKFSNHRFDVLTRGYVVVEIDFISIEAAQKYIDTLSA